MAKYCAYCGHQMGDADVFCASCGKRFNAPPAPVRPAAPAAPPQPQQNLWAAQQPQPRRQPAPPPQHVKPGSGKAGLLIGVIAAVVVIAAVLVGGFVWPGFFRNRDGGPEAPDVPEAEETEGPTATEAPKETLSPADAPAEDPTSPAQPTAPLYQNPFTDVTADDWYYDAVMWAGDRGVVSGTAFQPNDLTNRGQALTFLWRNAGKPAPTLQTSPYSDVKADDYFYEPVLWGFENGVISASGDGMFHAEGALTRAQAITFLFRAAQGSDTVGARSFSDVRADSWYFASANWALANGVVGRDTSWSFRPDQQMTRAMFVTFLYRTFAENAKKADGAAPAPEGLKDVGVDIDVDSPAPQSFRSVTKGGSPLSFTAEVTDYRVFEADGVLPKREGFEWRVMTVRASGTGLDGSALQLSVVLTDAWNVRLHQAGKLRDDSGMFTCAALCDGRLTDYTIWWSKLGDDNKGDSVWQFTASVPVGYDGVVVGFKNAAVDGSGRSIADYFTSEDDFALFRMK